MYSTCKLSVICSALSLPGVTSVGSLQVLALTEDASQSFPEWPLIFYILCPFPENSAKYSVQVGTAAAKSLQSCSTLCDPIDSSPPGSPVPGILQARTLEWVAISFSNAWKWKVKVKSLSRVWLLATPWTVAHQVPPSMGFSRQEYWSGVPLPSPCTVAGNIRTDFCACLHEPVG